MADKAKHRYANKDHGGEGEGDDDMARHRKAQRDKTENVGEQDEHEQAEDEREIPAAFAADVIAHHIGDHLVGHLGHGLAAPRHQGAVTHTGKHKHRSGDDDGQHPHGGIGQRNVEAADLHLDQAVDLELIQRAMGGFPRTRAMRGCASVDSGFTAACCLRQNAFLIAAGESSPP